MSEDNTQPEVEETPQPFDIEEPTDDMLSDRIDAYIAERKAAQDAGEEEGEGEEESDCPDGDCDEFEEEDSDLEALAARAAEVGLDEEDIAKIGNVENLERMVMILEARKNLRRNRSPSQKKLTPTLLMCRKNLNLHLSKLQKRTKSVLQPLNHNWASTASTQICKQKRLSRMSLMVCC